MTKQRIIHDESENASNYLDGETIQCIVADPPYGVNYRSRMAETPQGKRIVADIENDKNLEGALLMFHEIMVGGFGGGLLSHLADDGELYVFTRWDVVDVWMKAVRELPSIMHKMTLIWEKGDPGMGDIDANWGCGYEIILYAKRGRRDLPYRRSGIISVDKVRPRDMIHPTEKPVPLIEKLIEMSTNRGDLVVDPFSGSGATAVASQRLDRDCIAFESDAKYIPDSRARLESLVLPL